MGHYRRAGQHGDPDWSPSLSGSEHHDHPTPARGGTRTAAKLRQDSEESSLTSTPPCYQPTTTKRVLSKLSEDFAIKWLHYGPSPDDRMLLLEDCDTGDVLTLLVAGLPLFGENYSRKLANKAFLALASIPASWQPSSHNTGPRAWRAAFEAPPAVKALVRLHDPQAPKGHMCLLMLPVLYNALALSEEDRHRSSPLFGALHAALQASSYAALVFSPPQGWPGEAALYPAQPVFLGPRRPSACLAKYMVQPAGKPKRKRGAERGGPAASAAVAEELPKQPRPKEEEACSLQEYLQRRVAELESQHLQLQSQQKQLQSQHQEMGLEMQSQRAASDSRHRATEGKIQELHNLLQSHPMLAAGPAAQFSSLTLPDLANSHLSLSNRTLLLAPGHHALTLPLPCISSFDVPQLSAQSIQDNFSSFVPGGQSALQGTSQAHALPRGMPGGDYPDIPTDFNPLATSELLSESELLEAGSSHMLHM